MAKAKLSNAARHKASTRHVDDRTAEPALAQFRLLLLAELATLTRHRLPPGEYPQNWMCE